MKDGFLLVDASPINNPLLNNIFKYTTLKVGHFQLDYGDGQARRSDNGNSMYNPFIGNYILDAFTTEIGAEAILKGTRVAGIYDRDPEKDGQAVLLPRLTYFDVLEKSLRVMDTTAVTMAMEQNIPIVVFKLFEPGNLKKVVLGQDVGTVVEKRGNER